jgi:hypothetical protein
MELDSTLSAKESCLGSKFGKFDGTERIMLRFHRLLCQAHLVSLFDVALELGQRLVVGDGLDLAG